MGDGSEVKWKKDFICHRHFRKQKFSFSHICKLYANSLFSIGKIMLAHTLYNYRLIDLQSGLVSTTESILSQGKWQFLQLGNYTSVSPLLVSQGNSTKIIFQPTDIVFSQSNGLEINYDFDNQLFRPQTVGDLFLTEIRFKAVCSAQNGYADLLVTSPSFLYNPVTGSTFNLSKGAGVEQFLTVNGSIFVGEDLKANGFEVNIQAGSGNFSIYDVSFLSCRIGSGH